MWFCLVWVLLIIFCCPYSFQTKWNLDKDPLDEWNRMAEHGGVTSGSIPKLFKSVPLHYNFLSLPDFVHVSEAEDQKYLFEPEMGLWPVPDSVQSILFPTTTTEPPKPAEPIIEILCHLDRMYLRIRIDIFKTLNAWRFLNLGKCVVNQGTDDHYYFLYLLKTDCDFIIEKTSDSLIIKNVLHFLPTTPILRDLPFHIPVKCKYRRYTHSYKGAIRPKLQGGILHKSLRFKNPFPFQLIPQDEFGNEKTTPYNLEDTMFFEVKLPAGFELSTSERIYINRCFITYSLVPSSLQSTIIEKFGCMMDGKEAEDSKFLLPLSGSSMNTQRFSVRAGLLAEMEAVASSTKLLYMHCEVTVGQNTPSDGGKACNYDIDNEIWTELNGDTIVCSCCDTSCPPPLQTRAARSKVISQKVNLNYEEYDWMKKSKKHFGYEEKGGNEH